MRSGRPASGPQSPEKPVSVPSAVAVLCPPRGACQRAWGPGWGSTGFRARGITVTRAGPTLPLLPDRVSWPQTATAIWRLLIPTRNAICKTGRPPSRELSPAGIPRAPLVGCPTARPGQLPLGSGTWHEGFMSRSPGWKTRSSRKAHCVARPLADWRAAGPRGERQAGIQDTMAVPPGPCWPSPGPHARPSRPS